MAQSSNYKQYARSTRVLTEESSFSGGMLWTGNNIDETHLKTIVNFDYDDTTGFLKTRDPFIPIESVTDLQSSSVSLQSYFSFKDYCLLGSYNLCAFDTSYTAKKDDALVDAGWLYLFINKGALSNADGVWNTTLSTDNLIAVYKDYTGTFYKCALDLDTDSELTLCNSNKKNMLLLYDNYLYSIGVNSKYTEETEEDVPSWLQVFRVENNGEGYVFKHVSFKDYVLPKFNAVTLLESSVSGFNAARCNRTFYYQSEKISDSEKPNILGVYFTDTNNNVVVSPRIGQKIKIKVVTAYKEGKNYLALFQLKEGTSTDTEAVKSIWQYEQQRDSDDGVFSFNYVFQKKETVFAFTFFGKTAITGTPEVYAENAVDYLAPYAVVANDNQQNLKIKSYDLTSVDGSCIWRNRMCLWGTDGNTNCLFLSEVDNFYYYPVPHNVAVFDTNIISCIPYKNSLLVFTADKIYRLSENNDGSFVQDVVQNDMPLSKTDSAHLTAIKNMVLFKSGNYFYMVVPKSQSLTDELSIAPIYKNVSGFLNTLDKSVLEVLQLLYPEYLFTDCIIENNAAPVDVYSEQDTVHILYDISATVNIKQVPTLSDNTVVEASTGVDLTELKYNITTQALLFKLFLNYNTNLRAWTLYLIDTTESSLEVSALTASRLMSFIRINNNTLTDQENDDTPKFEIVTQQHSTDLSNSFRVLLDTGYRTLASVTQKRFREVQLKLYNASENVTAFGTAFLVDGVWRKNYSHLQELVTSDNVISLFPELDLNAFVTELSAPIDEEGSVIKAPGSDVIELSDWTLDFSHFQRGAPVTIRVPVSGKGFNPRFILMIPNALDVYINEVNWVYRIMHGR